MGWIEISQRTVSCRTEVCYPFCREHWKARTVKRREFITLLGGAAAAWPLAARAQQREHIRRIGVSWPLAADDPISQARNAAFLQALQQLGWTVGQNIQIDYRWSGGN